ncbi:hypothetical protein K435DRAFT_865130 [Dendrothele bispora CBS 962.96]|uniref:Uncharacterized protein n=1 Tax=Dendrothele bispora (strain CBS 962.96) TaxID=1314807 RepID=A0A4S8LK69_DENBC|nr:hypothetical protein K435DRAFT_865130 [Dendrothele bispora CBS 962.96]
MSILRSNSLSPSLQPSPLLDHTYTRSSSTPLSSVPSSDESIVDQPKKQVSHVQPSPLLDRTRSRSSSPLSSAPSSDSASPLLSVGNEEELPVAASIPENWQPLDLPGRKDWMPKPYVTTHHSKIMDVNHGKIIIMVVDNSLAGMRAIQKGASTSGPPLFEVERQASFLCFKSHYLIYRPKYGSGDEKDDIVKSWALSNELGEDTIADLEDLRERILGPEEELGPDKPVKTREGSWTGGCFFERSPRARNLKGSKRAYPVTNSNMVQMTMETITAGQKINLTGEEDDHYRLRRDAVATTTRTALKGVCKGAPDLLQVMNRHAKHVNFARIGCDENTIWTSSQLNIMGCVGPVGPSNVESNVNGEGPESDGEFEVLVGHGDDVEMERGDIYITPRSSQRKGKAAEASLEEVSHDSAPMSEHGMVTGKNTHPVVGHDLKRRKNNGGIQGLGKFGSNHADHGDSPVAPTAITSLTRPHDDVKPELFYLYDFGICWKLEEFSTVFFSGLHYHSGCQAEFNDIRTNESIYYRLTFILYPSEIELNGEWSVPIAALPKAPRHNVLALGIEGRNHASYAYDNRVCCNPATYIADGLGVMEEKSYLNHISRTLLQHIVGLVAQAPIGSERVQASQWDEGPGWVGEDTRAGKQYLDEENLAYRQKVERWNSDIDGSVPFGNHERIDYFREWDAPLARAEQSFPLRVVLANKEVTANKDVMANKEVTKGKGGTKAGLRGLTNAARKEFERTTLDQHHRGKRVKGRSLDKGKEKEIIPTDDNISHSGGSSTIGSSQNPDQLALRTLEQDDIASLLSFIGSDISFLQNEPVNSLVLPSKESAPDFSLSSMFPFQTQMIDTLSRSESSGCIHRQDLMLLNVKIWEWLSACAESGNKLRVTSKPTTWFQQLVKTIKDWLDTQGSPITLDAHDYLPSIYPVEGIEVDVVHPANNRKYYEDPWNVAIEWAVTRVTKWLRVDASGHLKACFCKAIIDFLGIQALVLPSVWKAHQNLRRPGSRAALTEEEIRKWAQTTLVHHHFFRKGGDRTQLLHLYRVVCMRRSDFESQWLDWLSVDSDDTMLPSTPLTSLSLLPSTYVWSSGRIVVRRQDLQFCPPNREAAVRFLVKIELLWILTVYRTPKEIPPSSPILPFTKPLNRFLKYVYDKADSKLPFRQFAPSLRNILAGHGPFSSLHLHTKIGYLSALIFRGVTFNSPFARSPQSPTLFHNADDWDRAVDKANDINKSPLPKNHFCNQAAYTNAISNRTADNIRSDFEGRSIGASDLELGWLLNPLQRITFDQLWKKFQQAPSFGSLVSYLLAADYAQAGLVNRPSPEEMGDIIHRINKGAKARLKYLGFSCRTKEETHAAFVQFHNFLLHNLQPQVVDDVRLDVFMSEHSLCKDKKLEGEDFEQLYIALREHFC